MASLNYKLDKLMLLKALKLLELESLETLELMEMSMSFIKHLNSLKNKLTVAVIIIAKYKNLYKTHRCQDE